MIDEKYMNAITADELGNLWINRSAEIGAAICSEVPWEIFNDCGANGNPQRQGGLSPKTLTSIRKMMHIAFDQALKNGMITVNLVESVRLPKAEKKEMRVLDREEQASKLRRLH